MRRLQALSALGLAVALVMGLGIAVAAQDGAAAYETSLKSGFSYGDDPQGKQVIHVLTLPEREEPRPAVIFFHGGGLVMGNPLQDLGWAKWIAGQGYVTFMAGYRLFDQLNGTNPWPAQLDDAQAVVRWVREHASGFNVDPDRVCAAGHSSGGHLAGLVGTTDARDTSASQEESSRVDCVVSVSGDADLTVPYDNSLWTHVFDAMLGGTIEEVPVEMGRSLAAALADAQREFVYAELPARHLDIGDSGTSGELMRTFLSYQLHPEQ